MTGDYISTRDTRHTKSVLEVATRVESVNVLATEECNGWFFTDQPSARSSQSFLLILFSVLWFVFPRRDNRGIEGYEKAESVVY